MLDLKLEPRFVLMIYGPLKRVINSISKTRAIVTAFCFQQCVSLFIVCKVVDDRKNVTIATLRAGQRAYNVHRDAPEIGDASCNSCGVFAEQAFKQYPLLNHKCLV